MALQISSIVNALAPGIALTSGIFYNNGLQTRLNLITGRARELNREARELKKDPDYDRERMKSIQLQVQMLTERARVIQRAALAAHGASVLFLATILTILILGLVERMQLQWIPVVLFSLGLGGLGYAMFLAISEMSLSIRTLFEDVRTSYPREDPSAAPVTLSKE